MNSGRLEFSSLDLEYFSLCAGYFVVLEAEVVFPSYVSYLCVLGFDFWWWFMMIERLSWCVEL